MANNFNQAVKMDPNAQIKLQELDRILHKGEMIKKNIDVANNKLRSQSVGGMGALGQLEMQELRNVANLDINNKEKKPAENDIEKNLFYMDEKGVIVNYLIHPPVTTMNREQMQALVQSVSLNKVVMTQIKRMTLMKQLNQKNLQNLRNKQEIPLPEKLQKGLAAFQTHLDLAYKQLDLIQKYQAKES